MTDKFKAELEASLAQAEHLSRALDKLLPRVGNPETPPEWRIYDRPAVDSFGSASYFADGIGEVLDRINAPGRVVHSSPFEPPTVVDDPEPDDIDGDDEGVR